jgi:hypothetical protein
MQMLGEASIQTFGIKFSGLRECLASSISQLITAAIATLDMRRMIQHLRCLSFSNVPVMILADQRINVLDNLQQLEIRVAQTRVRCVTTA